MKINLLKVFKVLGILLLLFIIAIVIFIFYVMSDPISTSVEIVKEPTQYEQLLKEIIRQEKIYFFLKKIPSDATEVQLFAYYDNVERECIILKFKINKEYIENELKKHEFINSNDKLGAEQNIYRMFTDNGRISIKDFTFYVLKDKEKESYYPQYFSYFTSIGVDKNLEHIIYYYILPNDYNYEGARKYYGL